MKKRNKFSLSNYRLTTMDMGSLVPIGLTEVLPGDTIQQATSALVRANPLVTPVMHPVHVRIHHWFVPFRLIWNEFEDFITGGPNGTSAPSFPVINLPAAGGAAVGSLADHLGVPTGVNSLQVSALPFRAYQAIWNENYRDQDLNTEAVVNLGSGTDTTTSTTLQKVCWEKDYFTSSRPWEQKGAEVTLPLGSKANVTTDGTTGSFATIKAPNIAVGDHRMNLVSGYVSANNITGGSPLYADLSSATAASINDLRLAFALQRYKEARARYGSRYVEYLRYLGIKSADARLDRPEYLGGGKQTIQFSEVLSTSNYVAVEASENVPVGAMKGHGIAAMRSNRFRKFFEEHGYVMTFMSAKPKTIYTQGLPRTFNRRVKEDFFQAELQHIGSQEVLNKEIYAAHGTPNGIFGYQDRYDEYRRSESSVSGKMRPGQVYEDWHMARVFANAPTLNGSFVESVPTKRNFADQNDDALLVMANHSIQARRLVAKTGSPLSGF